MKIDSETKFAVVLRNNNQHAMALYDVAEALFLTLIRLRRDVVFTTGVPEDRVPILFGAHYGCLSNETLRRSIVYNTENAESPWFSDSYRAKLSCAGRVWDYSKPNVERWDRGLVSPVQIVPFGREPWQRRKLLERRENKDIDVLFYGSLNKRRVHIIDTLRAHGLRVMVLCGEYERERDMWIARSKVVLNVHYYENLPVVEQARLALLDMSRMPVVSERSLPEPWGSWPGVPYYQLVDRVEEILQADLSQGDCYHLPDNMRGVARALGMA